MNKQEYFTRLGTHIIVVLLVFIHSTLESLLSIQEGLRMDDLFYDFYVTKQTITKNKFIVHIFSPFSRQTTN
jgi:hypothetical protein